MPTVEDDMAKWGEQFRFPRPQSFAEDAEAVRVTEEITQLEAFPFSPGTTTTLMPRGGCACVVANLLEFYYVESPDYELDGQITLSVFSTGDTCEDVVYTGTNDAGNSASLSFSAGQWTLGLDNAGDAATLTKDPHTGDVPDCDKASPTGSYTGDGFTAVVASDAF